MKTLNNVFSFFGLILNLMITVVIYQVSYGSGHCALFTICTFTLVSTISLFLNFVYLSILWVMIAGLIFMNLSFGGDDGELNDTLVEIKTSSQQSEYFRAHFDSIEPDNKWWYLYSYECPIDMENSISYRIEESWRDYETFIGDGKYTDDEFKKEWKTFSHWFLNHKYPEDGEPPIPKYLGDTDQVKSMGDNN